MVNVRDRLHDVDLNSAQEEWLEFFEMVNGSVCVVLSHHSTGVLRLGCHCDQRSLCVVCQTKRCAKTTVHQRRRVVRTVHSER